MDIAYWRAQLLHAVLLKLDARRDLLEKCSVRRLDIGIFPWLGVIELSIQSNDEIALGDRIGEWRLYNFTVMVQNRAQQHS